MILGMSLETFTELHTIISLVAIAAGLIVLFDMFGSHEWRAWTAFFFVLTFMTSATGFLFPRAGFTPAQGVGIVSLVVLAIAALALYGFHLRGAWRWIYVVGAVLALWLNVFVAVVQSFQKLAFLQPLAPTQSEPPFLFAQIGVMAIFVVLGNLAGIRFRPVGAIGFARS
jgi:hypothetical protein